ncbi:MAG: adenylate kinase [bacterium]|nr:adenylate kinase [bacterium]
MNIILLGAPGAGKGTHSEMLVKDLGLRHISTGDLLREEVKKASPVGLEAKGYMDKGALVPDAVVMKLLAEAISGTGKSGGFLLDGFPRNESQAEMLEKELSSAGISIDRVLYLNVSEAVVIKRLTGRRICKNCAAVYHVVNMPSRKEGICDKCGGTLYQRPDDTSGTVLRRLDVYRKETEGLINYYKAKRILKEVNADLSRDDTYALIRESLGGK